MIPLYILAMCAVAYLFGNLYERYRILERKIMDLKDRLSTLEDKIRRRQWHA